MTTPELLKPTDRSQVKRQPQRGHYDLDLIHQILDESLVIQVGFIADNQPFVIPMGYGRDGDRLYIHGASASRMLRNLEQGVDICVRHLVGRPGDCAIAIPLLHELSLRSAVWASQIG